MVVARRKSEEFQHIHETKMSDGWIDNSRLRCGRIANLFDWVRLDFDFHCDSAENFILHSVGFILD